MFMQSSYRNLSIYLFVAVAVVSASLFSIADLDFFWHLKTGDVILERKEFQHTEIYSFTAAGREYIDHEWLFQVVNSILFSTFGPAGVIIFKSMILALMYFLTTRHLLNEGASPLAVISIQLLSICGGIQRMIERPEIFTALFFVITFLAVHSFLKSGKWSILLILPPLFAIWSNFHAAVILGIVLLACFLAGLVLEVFFKRSGLPGYYSVTPKRIGILLGLLIVCVAITGLNPYGYRVLTVPFELTTIINTEVLNNEEWQPPTPFSLPLYYLCVLISFSVLLLNFRQLSPVHFLVTAFFAYISMKYVRNTGLFAWFMPLFLAPYLSGINEKKMTVRVTAILSVLVFLFSITIAFPFERGLGIASYFPKKLADFTKEKNLKGNMLNSYALGGYLIWSLYPERKIFIDGRNEVYLPLLKEIVKSRTDSRLWNRFIADHKINYALLNYIDRLEEVTIMGKNGEITKTYEPFSQTHFPRSKWALIYWDDTGMIFIKKDGQNAHLLPLEYKQTYPEGSNYMEALVINKRIPREEAINELQRKLAEDPGCKRAQRLLRAVSTP
jgi:hypothetical protein